MSVIFTSNKDLWRAENINTVFSAYEGRKAFAKTENWLKNPDMAQFKLRVADEFITASPGKAVIIGHGFGAIKTGGIDQPHPYYSTRFANLMDYVITTSEEMIPIVARQCGVKESSVLPLGMPRTDKYFRAKKTGGKRVYLYVPTWRTREETPLPNIDWGYIDESLTEDEEFIIKPHPMTGRILYGSYKRIREAPANEPSTQYLIDSDVVITDYSSILFDAHLLKKPVILLEKTPGYLETRGVYFNYPYDYASRFCTNEKDLVETMKTAKGQNEEDLLCIKRFASACDGHSTEKVIKLIESLI